MKQKTEEDVRGKKFRAEKEKKLFFSSGFEDFVEEREQKYTERDRRSPCVKVKRDGDFQKSCSGSRK